MPNALIQLTFNSIARLAIVPIQDILALDSQSRMNMPGTTEGNWRWRMQWSQLTDEKKQSFRHLVEESGRLHV